MQPRSAFIGLVVLGVALTAQGNALAEEQEEAAVEEAAPQSPTSALDAETPYLRFADRRQVLFRVGFGGVYQDAFLGNPKAQASYGVTLRWERPVHEYITTGLAASFFGTKPEFVSRQPAFEFGLHLKGRYPFEIGRKERKFESEVYLLAEGGFLLWLDTNASTSTSSAPVGRLAWHRASCSSSAPASVSWPSSDGCSARRFSPAAGQASSCTKGLPASDWFFRSSARRTAPSSRA